GRCAEAEGLALGWTDRYVTADAGKLGRQAAAVDHKGSVAAPPDLVVHLLAAEPAAYLAAHRSNVGAQARIGRHAHVQVAAYGLDDEVALRHAPQVKLDVGAGGSGAHLLQVRILDPEVAGHGTCAQLAFQPFDV